MNLADDKDFLSKLKLLSPQEWNEVASYTREFFARQGADIWHKFTHPCVLEPFRGVRRYLRPQEEQDKKLLHKSELKTQLKTEQAVSSAEIVASINFWLNSVSRNKLFIIT